MAMPTCAETIIPEIRDIDAWVESAESRLTDNRDFNFGERSHRLSILKRNIPAIGCFQRLHISADMYGTDNEHFFKLSRVLVGLVDQKYLSLDLVDVDPCIMNVLLKSCRLLTCKSLNLRTKKIEKVSWTVEDHNQTSVGTGVKDTLPLLRDVWSVINELPRKVSCSTQKWADASKLKLAVFAYDYDTAEREASQYLDDLEKEIPSVKQEIEVEFNLSVRDISGYEEDLDEAEDRIASLKEDLEDAEAALEKVEINLDEATNIKSEEHNFLEQLKNSEQSYQRTREAVKMKLMGSKR